MPKSLTSAEVTDNTFNGSEKWIAELDYSKLEQRFIASDIGQVYNRLQEAHRAIGVLVDLLRESNDHRDPVYYSPAQHKLIEKTLKKYGDINGE